MTIIKVARIGEGLRNIEANDATQRMPQPAGAEQPLPMWACRQSRMEEIRWPALRQRGERPPGFRFLQFDTAVVFGAMREQHAALRIIEQRDRVFVRVRVIEAAVEFTNDP